MSETDRPATPAKSRTAGDLRACTPHDPRAAEAKPLDRTGCAHALGTEIRYVVSAPGSVPAHARVAPVHRRTACGTLLPGRCTPAPPPPGPDTRSWTMPIRYHIRPDLGAVLARAVDPIEIQEVLAYGRSLERDTAYRRGMLEVVDLRGVRRFELDVADLGDVVEQDRASADAAESGVRTGRTVFVADDALVLAKLEVYRDLRRPLSGEVALFNCLDSAVAWADLPAGTPELFPRFEQRN